MSLYSSKLRRAITSTPLIEEPSEKRFHQSDHLLNSGILAVASKFKSVVH
jgi:hypothetical protein